MSLVHEIVPTSYRRSFCLSLSQVNLAFSLAAHYRARVGVLDLDIFGPSIPKLLGLETAGEPRLTSSAFLPPVRFRLSSDDLDLLWPLT
jgi:ATP-binding protein involved in chromosome partitioning